MLELIIVLTEKYDEETNRFSPAETVTLELEHSLRTMSKWESKYEKRFLGNDSLTGEEIFDYVKMMIQTKDYDESLLERLSEKNMQEINAYIVSSQTGTTFSTEAEDKNPKNRKQISSELIYYWMVKCDIPWEAQDWHLNRLFTLIRVYSVEEEEANRDPKAKPKPMSKAALTSRAEENARRKAKLQSRG